MASIRVALLVCIILFQASATLAQSRQISAEPNLPEDIIRQRVNAGTVTVITGGVDGVSNTDQQLASDMAAVLDVKNKLRVLPVIGYGSLQNVEDLLYLRGIDFGMVHSDVLRHLEQKYLLPSAKRKLRYITKLYDEPLHLLVNSSIKDVQQLDGQTVIVGRPGSGNEMSALTLIADLGIKPNTIHVPFEEGVQQVRSGQAAGMFVVTRRPAKKLQDVSADQNLRFLTIPITDAIARTYDAVNLTAEDYPNLISPGENIEVPQTSVVLAVYEWPTGSSRYENVTKFLSNFADKIPEFVQASRKDIWQELDPASEVKGWVRYEPAQKIVDAAGQNDTQFSSPGESDDEGYRNFVEYIQSSSKSGELSEEEIRTLYARFKLWQQTR